MRSTGSLNRPACCLLRSPRPIARQMGENNRLFLSHLRCRWLVSPLSRTAASSGSKPQATTPLLPVSGSTPDITPDHISTLAQISFWAKSRLGILAPSRGNAEPSSWGSLEHPASRLADHSPPRRAMMASPLDGGRPKWKMNHYLVNPHEKDELLRGSSPRFPVPPETAGGRRRRLPREAIRPGARPPSRAKRGR